MVEAQIHVVDVGHALAKRGSEIEVGLDALGELVFAKVQQRRIRLEEHDRVVLFNARRGVADLDRSFGSP